ncbi:MAG: hypothetical protein KKC68_00185 [Candidatus Thermoplasmatota archaeon]|nr:hypothetical protein [Candidatus Thermoplasmatota archaeon]MBU1940169.1 hypothetical protein [Candidatus Thermoplasmatota archaeon]
MSETIWCLTKGDKKIYTKNLSLADQAVKDGHFVKIVRKKPLKYTR